MRILGLDLGSASVKGVEIDTSFGRFEIHDYHEEKVMVGSTPFEAAGRLVKGLAKAPDRIVIGLPAGRVTFRNLQVPTKDRRDIQAAVAFELEDDLPFEIDDAVFDYSTTSQGPEGTGLHIAATLRKYVAEVLNGLGDEDIDPDLVTTETWAFRTMLNRILDKPVQERPCMLIQIGQSSTTLYVHWKGSPIVTHRFSWGGADLNRALQSRYGISPEEAETAKINSGFVLSHSRRESASDEQKDFSDTLLEPMQSLFSEIRQVMLACKNITQEDVRALYVCGGGSLLPGLRAVLEEQHQIPVYPLQTLSAISPSGLHYSEETDAFYLIPCALAIGLVGNDRSKTINLRKGDLAKRGQGSGFNLENLKRPLLGAAAVLFCLFASLAVQSRVYEGRIEQVNSELERGLKGFFGPLSKSALRTYLANTDRLKRSVTEELDKEREVAKLFGRNPRSPLDFLNAVSSKIPAGVVVDMTEFQVGAAANTPYSLDMKKEAKLTFLTDKKENFERLNQFLAGMISGIEQSPEKTIMDAKESKTKWEVSFSGSPMESAYGN